MSNVSHFYYLWLNNAYICTNHILLTCPWCAVSCITKMTLPCMCSDKGWQTATKHKGKKIKQKKKMPSILTLFNVQSSTPFSGDDIKSSVILRVFSISSPSMTNVLLRLCPRGSFSISFDILANSPWEHFLLLEFSLPIWLILSYHNACSSYHPFCIQKPNID